MMYCDECDMPTEEVEVVYQCQTCFSMLHPGCIEDHCRPDRDTEAKKLEYGGISDRYISSLIECERANVRLFKPSGRRLVKDPEEKEAGKP